MTLPIGKNPNKQSAFASANGFTLIELILVMALLSAIFAVASPSLARFFRGRSLEEEALRFLALTRYAKAQASTQGIPMDIWLDEKQFRYGLCPAPGYELDERQTQTLAQNPGEKIETQANEQPGWEFLYEYDEKFTIEVFQTTLFEKNYTIVRYLPDGTFDEPSAAAVSITQEGENPLYIAQTEYGCRYEILNRDEYERMLLYRSKITGIQ